MIDILFEDTNFVPVNTKKIVRYGEVLSPPVIAYDYINSTNNTKNIDVIALDSSESNWKIELLKQSFLEYNQNNLNLNLTILNTKNISKQLASLKNYLYNSNFNSEYVLLIDSNFLFTDCLNKLTFNKEFFGSKPFCHISTEGSFWNNTIDLVLFLIKTAEFYKKNLNANINIDKLNFYKVYGFPMYFKTDFLKNIISRWEGLTNYFYFNDHIDNNLHKNELACLYALSFCLIERNLISDETLDISYITSEHSNFNINYLLYNHRNKLISNATKVKIFDSKTYKPWSLINYTVDSMDYTSIKIFIEVFNYLIFKKTGIEKATIIPV
jgi:hypothetical protein